MPAPAQEDTPYAIVLRRSRSVFRRSRPRDGHQAADLVRLALVLLPTGFPVSFAQDSIPADPGARWGHAFIFDAANNQILLFGGARERGVYLDDTWVWDGSEWQQKKVPGPSARGFCAVTFHKERKSIILHGGRGNDRVTHSDTWEWNGSEWNQLEPGSDFSADHHAMLYDEKMGQTVLFGGKNYRYEMQQKTWALDNGELTVLSSEGPSPRHSVGFTYSSSESGAYLYGGKEYQGDDFQIINFPAISASVPWEWGRHRDGLSFSHHAQP